MAPDDIKTRKKELKDNPNRRSKDTWLQSLRDTPPCAHKSACKKDFIGEK